MSACHWFVRRNRRLQLLCLPRSLQRRTISTSVAFAKSIAVVATRTTFDPGTALRSTVVMTATSTSAANVSLKATAERDLATAPETWLVVPWLASLVRKSFVLIERRKVGIQVDEAAPSLVALLLELLVLKHSAAQRAGDVAREADLALGQGLAAVLATGAVGASTTARDHDRSHEHAPSLAQDSLVGLLLLPLLELSPGTL